MTEEIDNADTVKGRPFERVLLTRADTVYDPDGMPDGTVNATLGWPDGLEGEGGIPNV